MEDTRIKNITQQMSLQRMIGTLVRRRRLIIIPIALSFIISIILAFILPKKYEASSTVMVSRQRIIDPIVSNLAVSPNIREILNTLSRQALAWPRMEQLVTQLSMADDIKSPLELKNFIESLQERIDISLSRNELIQITYTDKDPEMAQRVVNTLTQNFIDENARIKKEEAQNAIDFISEQLNIYRKKLENSQKDFSASKVNSDLRIALNKKSLLENRLANLQELVPTQVTREQTPLIIRLNRQIALHEAELANLMIDAKTSNPRVIELEEIIKKTKERIKQAREKENENITESVSVTNPLYLHASQELKQVEMEIDYLQKREKELQEIPGELKKPVTEEQLATLEWDKQVDEDIYQMLLHQLESAYVSERLQDSDKGSKFTIIEYARLPLTPVKPSKKKVVFFGLFCGFALSAGLVYFIEYFDKSFLTIEEVRNFLPMQFLGIVSRMKLGKKTHNKVFSMLEFLFPYSIKRVSGSAISPYVVSYHDPQSIIAEEHRILQSHILNAESGNPIKTIMITSSVVGEGKSVTSANLAVAMALSGKNTLLIDCDFRKGNINELFSIAQSPGVTDVINGTTDIKPALVGSSVKNLTIMPRGNNLSNSFELIESKKMEHLFNHLKNHFEIIIVDTPPVLNLPDLRILGRLADRLILVVQMERTQRDDVMDAHAVMENSKVNIDGYVLTNTQYYMPKSSYYYGRTV